MQTGETVDCGERPPLPGPMPMMPSRDSFARAYYARAAPVSSLAKPLVNALFCLASCLHVGKMQEEGCSGNQRTPVHPGGPSPGRSAGASPGGSSRASPGSSPRSSPGISPGGSSAGSTGQAESRRPPHLTRDLGFGKTPSTDQ